MDDQTEAVIKWAAKVASETHLTISEVIAAWQKISRVECDLPRGRFVRVEPLDEGPIGPVIWKGVCPPPWRESLALHIPPDDWRVQVNGRPLRVGFRILSEPNYQMARAAVNAQFEEDARGDRLQEVLNDIEGMSYGEQIARRQARQLQEEIDELRRKLRSKITGLERMAGQTEDAGNEDVARVMRQIVSELRDIL